jgi:hypothetical protein
MIGSLLCRLGFHNWTTFNSKLGILNIVVNRCIRCNKKNVNPSEIKEYKK